jgi:hypothetical protein
MFQMVVLLHEERCELQSDELFYDEWIIKLVKIVWYLVDNDENDRLFGMA